MNPNAEPYPKNISRLALALTALPGINRRAAEKIALSAATDTQLPDLAQAIREWQAAAVSCNTCNGLTDRQTCQPCQTEPHPISLCVVETQADAWAIQRAGNIWQGGFHILGGTIDPINGVSAKDIMIDSLLDRVQAVARNPMSEVLLAMSNTTQGNLTAQLLTERIREKGVTTTVLSRGIANGAQVKTQAPATLKAAFTNRRPAGR